MSLDVSKGPGGNRCPGKGTEGPLEHVVVTRLKLEVGRKGKEEQKERIG